MADQRIRDTDVAKLQAKVMLAKRISGASIDDLATQFNTSPDTVTRRIKLAIRQGLLDEATDNIFNDLVPMALEVFRAALKSGDVNVAKDVLFGTGVLKKNPPADQAQMTVSAELTLDQYRAMMTAQEDSGSHDSATDTQALLPASLPPHGQDSPLLSPPLREGHIEDGVEAIEQSPSTPTSDEGT